MNEISVFLKEYVFRHTSKKLDELVLEVSELDDLERTGYPCRECGQKFKYHSTRVKYVVHRTIKFKLLNGKILGDHSLKFCRLDSPSTCSCYKNGDEDYCLRYFKNEIDMLY